jgi:DNA-binding response OmpR family regulator
VLEKRDLRTIEVERLSLDLTVGRTRFGQRELMLTRTEMLILACLMRNAGDVVERSVLFEEVWKDASPRYNRCLSVYVHWLRIKVERELGLPRLIRTIRGFDYRLDPDAAQ